VLSARCLVCVGDVWCGFVNLVWFVGGLIWCGVAGVCFGSVVLCFNALKTNLQLI
jgi:hypothetical protein